MEGGAPSETTEFERIPSPVRNGPAIPATPKPRGGPSKRALANCSAAVVPLPRFAHLEDKARATCKP